MADGCGPPGGLDDTTPAAPGTLTDARGAHASSPALVAGTRVGRYLIERRLGAGGMGVVYAARDPELGRSVAIKLLHTDAANQHDLLEEGRTTAKLRHPNVVTIHDVGWHEDRLFIAMELVTGGTLRTWLETPRKAREILAAFLGAGAGLAAAHAAGLVHRDFKPDNVLVDGDGRVLVTDFGLAHVTATTGGDSAITELTRRGDVVGTPAYMSPEQFAGDPCDARSDLFSFCVALAEAIQGFRPFAGASFTELREAVITKEPRLELPRTILGPVRRGLVRDRDQRTASMTALLDELRPRHRAAWIAGGLAVASVSTAIVLALRGTSSTTAACHAQETQLDSVWTDLARAMIRARSTKFGDADVSQLDMFRVRWKRLHHDACEADSRAETRTEADHELSCLERSRLAFVAALTSKPYLGNSALRLPLPDLEVCASERPVREVRERPIVDQKLYSALALSPDGRLIAAAQGDAVDIMAIDGSTRRSIAVKAPLGVAWDREDVIVVTATELGRVRAGTMELVATGPIPDPMIAMSPTGDRALSATAGKPELVDLQSHARVPAPTAVPIDGIGAVAWSGSDQVAFFIDHHAPDVSLIRVVDLRTGATDETPIRLADTGGGTFLTWLDATTLVVNGGATADAGVGLWGVSVIAGRFATPISLLRGISSGLALQPLDSVHGSLLVNQVVSHSELARIRDGKRRPIAAASAYMGLWGIDAPGGRLAVTRASEAGILDLVTGTYTKLVDLPLGIAFSDDGPLGAGVRLPAPPEALDLRVSNQCAALAQYLCVISHPSADGTTLTLRDRGTSRVLRSLPRADPRFTYFALSPSGDRVAYTTGDKLQVIDLATDREETWADPTTGECSSVIQIIAWSRQSTNALYFTRSCDGSAHVRRAERGHKEAEIFGIDAWFAGIAIGPDDELFVNERRYASTLVVLDGL